MSTLRITPALLAKSHEDLEAKLARFAMVPRVRRIQLDVVDGRFATPASWPYTEMPAFRTWHQEGKMLPLIGRFSYEMDLMVLEPEAIALAFIAAGASRIIIHSESVPSLGRTLALLRRQSGHSKDFVPDMISIGLAINIATDLALIEPHLADIDFVQCMGIAKIGRQGEPFDRRVLEKLRVFRLRHPEIPVQVDGGVTLHTAPELIKLGVDALVVGHDLLEARDIPGELARFDALY